MSLRWVRVGDVLKLERRSVEVDPASNYREIGVRSFGKGIFHKDPVSGVDIGSKRVFRIEPGDLVVSNIFAWEGVVACAGESERGFIGSHRFMTWVPTSGQVAVEFLAQYLLSECGIAQLRRASPGSAARNRTLGIGAFENLTIPLPDLDEQRRIAARLDAIAAAVVSAEVTTARRGDSRGLAPRLVEAAFADAGLPRVPARELYSVVSDVVHPGMDASPAVRFVGLEHVEPHTGRRLSEMPLGSFTGRKLRFLEGDVLYGCLRPYQNKVWRADGPGLCSVEQYVLRPREGVNADLLGYALRSQATLDRVNEATQSLQLPRIRTALLGIIDVPDVREADDSLLVRLESITAQVARLDASRTRQVAALRSLLPAARNEEFAGLTPG
jgi:type I restriction enzyme S subunit